MKEKLKNFIAKGKTEKTIQILFSVTKNNPRLYNEVVILSNHFTQYSDNKRMGINSPAEQRRNLAQINHMLLEVIDRLNEEQLDIDMGENRLEKVSYLNHSRQRTRILFIIAAVILIIGASSVFILIKEEWYSENIDPITEDSPNNSDSINIEQPGEPLGDTTITGNERSENTPIIDIKPPILPDTTIEQTEKPIQTKADAISILRGDFRKVSGDSMGTFYIGKHEVTVGQFLLFCQLTGHLFPEEVDTTKKNLPITYVSWYDASAYCTYVKGKLPTAAQWEYAASGGNKSQGFKYSGSDDARKVAWSGLTDGPMPVATKKIANELGLYDMSGNVKEWCRDSSPGMPGHRKARGGGWKSYKHELAIKNETNHRASLRNSSLGFRIIFD